MKHGKIVTSGAPSVLVNDIAEKSGKDSCDTDLEDVYLWYSDSHGSAENG